MEEIEKKRPALNTSTASSGVFVYQGNFQLHLSASVLMFLSIATQADASLQKRAHVFAARQHCISVFQKTASNILMMDYYSIGWGDAIMVSAGLQTIATSPVSLPVQRDAARKILGVVKDQLGFRIGI